MGYGTSSAVLDCAGLEMPLLKCVKFSYGSDSNVQLFLDHQMKSHQDSSMDFQIKINIPGSRDRKMYFCLCMIHCYGSRPTSLN